MSTVEQAISHYQRDIEKIASRPERALKYEDRLLYCLNKLKKLPVTVNHLQTTGVGKTVNSLRKLPSQKGVSEAAKSLVAKWKNMVIEEDEDEEEEKEVQSRLNDVESIKKWRQEDREYAPERVEGPSVNYKPSKSASTCNSYSPEHLSQGSDTEMASYSPSKKANVPNGYHPGAPSSNGIEVLCYSPSKKSQSKESEKRKRDKYDTDDGHKSKTSKTERRTKEERNESKSEKSSQGKSESKSKEHKQKEKSSSSGHSSSSSKGKEKSSSSSSTNKSDKKEKPKKEGIDSMSGASFAEALGPMVVKKSSSSSSSSVKKKSRSESVPHSSSSSSKNSHGTEEKKSKMAASSAPADTLLDDVAGPSRLTPLDLDIVSTLSVPTPNYRPMPQPPMNSAERRQRVQAEEDALARIMSNKNRNARTKVYSGVKGGLSHVPSLYEICCGVLKLHIDSLEYTGGIPYSLLKPVLDSATPAQLYQFEHYNPYMIGETDHLWEFHVKREFRGEAREEMETWRDMYLRCMDEREEKYKAVTANIQQSIQKSVPVRQTKLAYVDVAKPPRSVLRKQIKNGTGPVDVDKMMGKGLPGVEKIRPPPPPRAIERPRVSSIFKPKVAPLMQKTLKSIKQTRFKR